MFNHAMLAIVSLLPFGGPALPLDEGAPPVDHTVTVLVKRVEVVKDGDALGCGELSHAEMIFFDDGESVGNAFAVPDAVLETWKRSNGEWVDTLRICKPTTYPVILDQVEAFEVVEQVFTTIDHQPEFSTMNRAQFSATPGEALTVIAGCGELDWLAGTGTFAMSEQSVVVPSPNTAQDYSIRCSKVSAGHRLDLRFHVAVVTSKHPA